MKLLGLTNRFYFASIIVIVIIGGFVSYLIFKTSINRQFNEKLLAEREQLLFELHNQDNIQDAYYLNVGDKVTLEPINSSIYVPLSWSDTLLFDEFQKKNLTFRQIRFSNTVDNRNYLITISKSLLSTDEMIRGIGEVMLLLMFSLIISLILLSNRINKTVWQPFYDSLNFLRTYDLTKPSSPKFDSTRIEEFRKLNEVINAMIEKSINDYENLKEFSENASHEIQTPLSIIKTKAELLMQDETLREEQINGISTIYAAANRLSRLNHDLAFLTKIDNNQFNELKTINLKEFLNNKLEEFEDLIDHRNIVITKNFIAEPRLKMNDALIHVLITNLLNNAIKHNVENGVINLKIKKNELVIENSGNVLQEGESAKDLFQRFRKASPSKESSGLGLALIKKICDLYGYKIVYSVNKNKHKIVVVF